MLAVLLVCTLAGCASGASCYDATTSPELIRTLYIVKRGWHTGVAIAAADWPDRDWALLDDFPEADYLEFGWGDARFYQAERDTLWLGIRAALWPTSSVIHVIGLRKPVIQHALADEVVEVRVSASGLRRMAAAIQQEFADSIPVATPVSLGAAPEPNHFYAAERRFFFPRMCNWWIATHLEEAGCPIQPWTVIGAGRVMRQSRSFDEQK